MEVHHHPHVEKKGFKGYFLEFLMIFLAVTLGFFAESLREHMVDKRHEREYIHSFYEDLSNDERELPSLIISIEQQQLQTADSLQALLPGINTKTPANTVYTSLRKIIRQQGVMIFVTERTIQEIKNAGEMRLISDKQVSDSLVDYYKQADFIEYLQQTLLTYKSELKKDFSLILKNQDYNKVMNSREEIFNPGENLYLLSTDPFAINKILIEVSEIRGLSHTIQQMIEELLVKAGNIKKIITHYYNIQD
ncbi:MAG: hypothetical protein KGM98_14730 [Bacteroidota bacterium]|nr:hypothetical protein [Bacteroidota bacterium]